MPLSDADVGLPASAGSQSLLSDADVELSPPQGQPFIYEEAVGGAPFSRRIYASY
jgi:hypothetical protein